MTELDRRNPRFVTSLAVAYGARLLPTDWPSMDYADREPCPAWKRWSVTGHGFDSALVVCTHADLEQPEFRAWLLQTLSPRIEVGGSLRIELL